MLRELDPRACRRAMQSHVDLRHPILIQERVECRRDRQSTHTGERLQKIVGGRRPILPRVEILTHAAPEPFFADPAFEHADDRCALLISDVIEGVEYVATRGDRLADPPRRSERVGVDCLRALIDPSGTAIVGRSPLVHHLLGDPRRERFVQPNVVPPRGRDEIAEPLVRHFVRADIGRTAAESWRRGIRLREQTW